MLLGALVFSIHSAQGEIAICSLSHGEGEDPKLKITSEALFFKTNYQALCLRLVSTRQRIFVVKREIEYAVSQLVSITRLFYSGYATEHTVEVFKLAVRQQVLALKQIETQVLQIEGGARTSYLRYENALKQGRGAMSDAELLKLLENSLTSWQAQRETLELESELAKEALILTEERMVWCREMRSKGYMSELDFKKENMDLLIAGDKSNSFAHRMDLIEKYMEEIRDYMDDVK